MCSSAGLNWATGGLLGYVLSSCCWTRGFPAPPWRPGCRACDVGSKREPANTTPPAVSVSYQHWAAACPHRETSQWSESTLSTRQTANLQHCKHHGRFSPTVRLAHVKWHLFRHLLKKLLCWCPVLHRSILTNMELDQRINACTWLSGPVIVIRTALHEYVSSFYVCLWLANIFIHVFSLYIFFMTV